MEVTVECQKRPEGSKPRALRRSGLVPAVLYGHQGTESVELTLKAKVAETLLKQATVNNTLIQLDIPELPWKGSTLLREVQTHPWKSKEVYHLSFFSVAAHGAIDVEVPLHFVGEAVGVKAGGVLEPVITQIRVHCDPDKIPESVNVDVSNLGIGESLQINQLVLPEGITALNEQELTIATVIAPRAATEATAASSAEG
ncbi:MAG TPA: 50S ribosomal protein L25/general stress protein Ctc [Coleofasciculaceae cyanobacterium]